MPEDWVGVASGRQSCFTRGREIHDAIEDAVRHVRQVELRYVERRILEGDDKVTVRCGDRQYVYTVPDWRTQPLVRLKVWRARRNYQRSRG